MCPVNYPDELDLGTSVWDLVVSSGEIADCNKFNSPHSNVSLKDDRSPVYHRALKDEFSSHI